MATYILNNVEFALRYDYTQTVSGDPWKVVSINSVDRTGSFSLTTAGTNADNSWMMLFTTDGVQYTLKYRGLDYIYSSTNSVRFLNTNPTSVYDSRTNKLIKDNVKVLQSNLNYLKTGKLDRDVTLEIYENSVEADGYTDSTKVKVTFPTGPNSDLPLDPEIFKNIVGPYDSTYVFYQKYLDYDNLIRFQLLDSGTISYAYATKVEIDSQRNNFPAGRLFYATTDKKFYQIVNNGIANTIEDVSTQYQARRSDRK
jgi:hypothetical protein